jgi:hypothetical protein
MIHAAAAVGGDDFQIFFIRFEQARDKITAARFKKSQDVHFVFKTFLRIGAMIIFDHAPVEAQVDGGAESVFDFQHGGQIIVQIAGLGKLLHALLDLSKLAKIEQPDCRAQFIGDYFQPLKTIVNPARNAFGHIGAKSSCDMASVVLKTNFTGK